MAAALLAAGLLALPASADARTVTGDVPNRRGVDALVVRTSTADAPVQVNVDIGLRVKAGQRCVSDLPGACKGGVYHPCFNPRDPAYAACRTYTLFEVLPPGLDLLEGITVPAASRTRSGRVVRHDWGGKTTEVHLEVYAQDPLGRFGDVRLRIRDFPEVSGGTARSRPVGHLHLPLRGALDTGVLTGRAVGERGQVLPPLSFKLDAFGHANTQHRTGLLGGRREVMTGFGGARIEPGVRDGRFSTGPLWRGAYDVHVQRRGRGWRCGVTVGAPEVRFDLDFRKADLGRRCRPMRALLQQQR